MSRSRILIVNTLATYARSVFSLALGLFSSRWILSALGESDYGLFSVVGSIIVFITLVNGAMSGSAARHFAYAIGEGKPEEVRRWFNASLSLHACFAIGLTLIGLPIGEYVISHYLIIPEGRMRTAQLVFRISSVSAFVSMISVPFVGIFTAKQRFAELAVWGMLQTVFTVSLAFALTQIKGNLLLVYAVGMTCILCSIQLIMIARASFRFHECRLVFADWFDLARIKQLASFASWNLIGILGSTLRNQGTAILLNIHFGTKVNAAYGISSQLSSATDQLSSAMMGAFSPEITNCEAQGDRKRMLSLAQSANKIGTILILLFAIPLLLEMEFVLTLWLKTPPLHSALFCRLILIMFLIDRLTSGYILAVHAYGRVAAYQTTLGSILVITLPIAWFFIRLGYPSESVGFAFIITMIFCSLGRVVWMKRLFDVSPGLWLWNTVFPCLAVASSSCAVGLLCHQFMIPSFIRLILLCALTLITSGLASCVFALAPEERVFLEKNAGSLLMKARSLSAAFRICY